MIHVLTAHHHTAAWIDIQLSYLRRHMSEPFRTVASLEGVPAEYALKFDVVVPSMGMHAGKLNLMASMVCDETEDEDLLMFLDGDAFPVADPVGIVRPLLAEAKLVAVRRAEELGDRQPHPLFCVTTVGLWKTLPGDWATGHCWENEAQQIVTDVGGNLLFLLEQAGIRWVALERTNRRNLHPVLFGVYGDVIYHHGAGFRVRHTRRDAFDAPAPAKPTWSRLSAIGRYQRRRYRRGKEKWARAVEAKTDATSRWIVDEMQRDPEFYRLFLGRDGQ